MGKKAILVVSFGTSYREQLEKCIGATERVIAANFQDYEVRRAFTSQFIIKKLAQRDNMKINNTADALAQLKTEGFQEVIVQPLHIIPGFEYEKILDTVNEFIDNQSFASIKLGRPLLTSTSDPNDYEIAVDALKHHLPPLARDQMVLLMGHGSEHGANTSYFKLQAEIDKKGLPILIGAVEANPTLTDLMDKLKTVNTKKLLLVPFMVVAGDHTQNDLAGDGEDSWKTQLVKAGYQVKTYLVGLGASAVYQQIYVQHIQDAIYQPV